MEKNTSTPDHSSRVANAVTTAAISLTLISCVDPNYQSGSPGQGKPQPPNRGGNPGTQAPTTYTDNQAYDKYFNNGYNYIDAMVLASYWGESTGQAKLTLGYKMLNFGPQDGRYHVSQARSRATQGDFWDWPVSYDDGGYSYNDAEILGNYWGGGPSNAKMKLARNLINGNDSWNRSALNAAR